MHQHTKRFLHVRVVFILLFKFAVCVAFISSSNFCVRFFTYFFREWCWISHRLFFFIPFKALVCFFFNSKYAVSPTQRSQFKWYYALWTEQFRLFFKLIFNSFIFGIILTHTTNSWVGHSLLLLPPQNVNKCEERKKRKNGAQMKITHWDFKRSGYYFFCFFLLMLFVFFFLICFRARIPK